MLRSVCAVACVRVYMCACVKKHLSYMNTVRIPEMCNELSTSVYSETLDSSKEIALLLISNTHVQYIHTDWVERENNKLIFSHTLTYCGTTDTL